MTNTDMHLLEALRDAYKVIGVLSRIAMERERLLHEIRARADVPEAVRLHISERMEEIDRAAEPEEQ
jgi:hypothetical protein